ncbi:MAG: hypothetical protein AB8B77_01710 [Alphaproteobacteria bacterium]
MLKKTLIAGGFALFLSAASAPSFANNTAGSQAIWQPSASEMLVKMPTASMQKKIERDFRSSPLASALQQSNVDLGLKQQTLESLNQTLTQTQGEMNVEVRHQILSQKRDYLTMVGGRNTMRKQAAETRITLYRDLLEKMQIEKRGLTPEKQALIAKQEAARARAQQNYDLVETAIFSDGPGKNSKYNQDYNKNQALIEQLIAKVGQHKANQSAMLDGEALSKQDYLRQLIADTEADIALVDQENQILGLMSKLVALDAMALSEEVADAQDMEAGIDPEAAKNPLHNVANLFIGG